MDERDLIVIYSKKQHYLGIKIKKKYVILVIIGLLILFPSFVVKNIPFSFEAQPTRVSAAKTWDEIDNFIYQLQNFTVEELAEAPADLAIIDYSFDGTSAKELTKDQVSQIQTSSYKKKVISYMSIGEAEDYRYYWNESWYTNPPEWLDAENPDWEGNYKVKYWYPEWQRIIFGTNNSYLDKIIAAGFDGVYLDIIDAYQYYEDKGYDFARAEMINFVLKIAEYARNKTNNPDWGIFPQNAEELTENDTYLQTITGLGRENVYIYPVTPTPQRRDASSREQIEQHLDRIVSAGKLVLVVEYTNDSDDIRYVYESAAEKGYLAYVTVLDLNQITLYYTTVLEEKSTFFDFRSVLLAVVIISGLGFMFRNKNKKREH